MGISFWHKKKEEPQAPKAVPENGVNAVKIQRAMLRAVFGFAGLRSGPLSFFPRS